MLRTIASLGDRMVALLVPRVDVAAGPCFYRCCWRGIAQYCCANQSTGKVSCGSCSVSYNCSN